MGSAYSFSWKYHVCNVLSIRRSGCNCTVNRQYVSRGGGDPRMRKGCRGHIRRIVVVRVRDDAVMASTKVLFLTGAGYPRQSVTGGHCGPEFCGLSRLSTQGETKLLSKIGTEYMFTIRGQSYFSRLPKYWPPPPPLRPASLPPPPRNKGGGYTLPGRRGGWGVNILERNRIALLQ